MRRAFGKQYLAHAALILRFQQASVGFRQGFMV